MTTQIYLITAAGEAAAAEPIRTGLEVQGYAVWTEPARFGPETAVYALEVERGVRASAAAVLLWSAAAAQDAWVERKLLHAQQLRKPLVALCRDTTELPSTLVAAQTLAAPELGQALLNRLRALLPPPDQDDLLLALLTNELIATRKQGIAEASQQLQRGERVEQNLALLEDLARNDQFDTVRHAARAALAATQPAPQVARARETQHMVGVRCANGHISYFDRREICRAQGTLHRSVERAGKTLDELILECTHPGCGAELKARIDCEGYR